MTRLEQLIKTIRKTDINEILREIFTEPDMQAFIVALNTDDPKTGQLFKQSVNRDGKTLKSIAGSSDTKSGYSLQYIKKKKSKGLPTDRITLLLDGDYYDSHEIEVGKDFIVITSDPTKGSFSLFNKWGEEIVGLTDENKQRVIDAIKPKIKEAVLSQLAS